MKISDILLFFEEFLGKKASDFYALPKSGSARKNFVGKDEKHSFIITYNENLRENEAFFYFSKIFSKQHFNTPKILKINEKRNLYIQQFVGGQSLSEIIAKEGESENVKFLVKESLRKLFEIQTLSQGKIDYSKTFEYETYDELPVVNDLFYFKSFFADVLEIPYHKYSLLKEFKKIAEILQSFQLRTLMLRDFQARNILIDKNTPYFIDYQSAMMGLPMYDAVSFLFQAKAGFSEKFKTEMLNFYLNFWQNLKEKNDAKRQINYCKLMRYVQVLGAYGFRGIVQRKPHFLNSIEKGVANLAELSKSWKEMSQFTEFQSLINNIDEQNITEKIIKINRWIPLYS